MSNEQSRAKTKPQSGQTAIAVESLGSRIVQRYYTPEKALPIEPVLAEELGVSRNSLREAIKVLSGKGLVSATPRRGTFVKAVGDWNLLDKDILNWYLAAPEFSLEIMAHITEMRHIIEPQAAQLAAKRATREDVAIITSAYHKMEQSIDNNLDEFVEADVEFHDAVLQATHNMVLSHFRNALTMLLKPNFVQFASQQTFEIKKNIIQHRDLAFAIAAGDEEKAYTSAVNLLDFTDGEIGKLQKRKKKNK
jgi:GntR family transcriptional regulator, galactonate operon transcriptional repressor